MPAVGAYHGKRYLLVAALCSGAAAKRVSWWHLAGTKEGVEACLLMAHLGLDEMSDVSARWTQKLTLLSGLAAKLDLLSTRLSLTSTVSTRAVCPR